MLDRAQTSLARSGDVSAVALVRGFGMSRPQVLGLFCWQAAATCAIAGAIGIPLGVAIGRLLWRYSTRNLGVVDAFGVPLLRLVGVVAAAAGVALAAAATAAVPRLRRPIATDLRVE